MPNHTSTTKTHAFEIWEGLPGSETFSGNRFSNLQAAASSVVIRSEIRRLWARSHNKTDLYVYQMRHLGNVYRRTHCKEFLANGYQVSSWKREFPQLTLSGNLHRVYAEADLLGTLGTSDLAAVN